MIISSLAVLPPFSDTSSAHVVARQASVIMWGPLAVTALPPRPSQPTLSRGWWPTLIEAFSANVEKLNEPMFTIVGVTNPVPGIASGVRARTDRNSELRDCSARSSPTSCGDGRVDHRHPASCGRAPVRGSLASEQLDSADGAGRILHPGDRPTGCCYSRHYCVRRFRDHPVSPRRRSPAACHGGPRRRVTCGMLRPGTSARLPFSTGADRLDFRAGRLVRDCGRRVHRGLAARLPRRDGIRVGIPPGAAPIREPRLLLPNRSIPAAGFDRHHSRRSRLARCLCGALPGGRDVLRASATHADARRRRPRRAERRSPGGHPSSQSSGH